MVTCGADDLLMVGVDDEQTSKRVHIERIGFELLIRHGEAHAQEIVDIAARVIRIEHRLVTAAAQDVADDRARLRHDDRRRLVKLVGVAYVGRVRVERRERVDRRRHDAHRLRLARERPHEGAEILADHRMVVDVVDEPLVLRGRGQFAVTQQFPTMSRDAVAPAPYCSVASIEACFMCGWFANPK